MPGLPCEPDVPSAPTWPSVPSTPVPMPPLWPADLPCLRRRRCPQPRRYPPHRRLRRRPRGRIVPPRRPRRHCRRYHHYRRQLFPAGRLGLRVRRGRQRHGTAVSRDASGATVTAVAEQQPAAGASGDAETAVSAVAAGEAEGRAIATVEDAGALVSKKAFPSCLKLRCSQFRAAPRPPRCNAFQAAPSSMQVQPKGPLQVIAIGLEFGLLS